MRIGRKALAVSVAALCLVGLGAGVTYASIPGPDGVIHGCYKTADLGEGSLFVIDSAATCPTGYTALNWNQTAPAPITQTRVARHVPADGTFFPETVTCPSGTHAVNGGVSQSEAVGWPGGTSNGFANAAPGFEGPSTSDPVNLSLPRPVDGGTTWRMDVAVNYPVAAGVQYDIDITLFAICI